MRAKHAQRVVVNAGCGSVARLDSRQIVCSSHAGGATGGNVSDVAWDRQGGGYPEPPQDGPEGVATGRATRAL
jgi:hypothetical protein